MSARLRCWATILAAAILGAAAAHFVHLYRDASAAVVIIPAEPYPLRYRLVELPDSELTGLYAQLSFRLQDRFKGRMPWWTDADAVDALRSLAKVQQELDRRGIELGK